MKRVISLMLLVASVAFAQELQLVTRVIDGDTIELESGEQVRLLGIDTPELKPYEWFADEATTYLEELVYGQKVRLEYDCIAGRYHEERLLAYVYLPTDDDELFINLVLVEEGYAFANRYPLSDEMNPLFLLAEKVAIILRKGVWETPQLIETDIAYKTEEQLYGIFDDSDYWLNSNGTRHNSSCEYYENTKSGRHCGQYEGNACGECGG